MLDAPRSSTVLAHVCASGAAAFVLAITLVVIWFIMREQLPCLCI